MNSKKRENTQFFQKERETLYKRIIYVGLITAFIISILQIVSGNTKEVFYTVFNMGILTVSFIFFKMNYKALAHHTILIVSCAHYIYISVILGNYYEAILLFYSCALLFSFIVFEDFKVLVSYLVFFITNQLIYIYVRSGAITNGISDQIIAEFINIVIMNIFLFLMAHFYLSNLKKTKIKLEKSIQDVESQAATLSEKNHTLQKYIESNTQLENYAYLAAHELKAPLRAVKEFSNILQRTSSHKFDEDETEMFDFISTNTEKMSILLDDLNKLSQVSKLSINMEEIDTEELLDEIQLDRKDIIEDKSAKIEHIGNIANIQGQRSLLKQLFSNLIGNSLKFVEDKQPHIRIESEYRDNIQQFKIMDNGIGIKPESRDKIFQIFTRLNSQFEYEGSGIGLAICKKIVDLHKGTISVEDSELGGICFNIRLPKQ